MAKDFKFSLFVFLETNSEQIIFNLRITEISLEGTTLVEVAFKQPAPYSLSTQTSFHINLS